MYYIITKNQPYYSSLMSLSLLGLYPRSSDPMSAKISFAVTAGTIIFYLIICNIGGIGHLIVSFKGSKGAEMSEDMAVAVGGLGFLMCESLFKRNGRKWITFFLSITEFKTFGKPHSFDKIKDRCNLYSIIFSFYIVGGNIVAVDPLLFRLDIKCDTSLKSARQEDYKNVKIFRVYAFGAISEMHCDLDKENNFCGTLTQIRLPIKGIIPPLIIKIIFFVQFLLWNWACVGSANIFVLTAESSEFLICHINSLKIKIKEIYHFGDEASKKKQLLLCINYHKTIIRWSMQLNDLVRTTLGHMTLIAAILMGMIGNQVINMYKPVGAALYLGGYGLAMFCISHAGQRLSDGSLSINDAVYDSEWNTSSSKMRKDLAFMMLRSQKPLILRALPLGNLNYALFITDQTIPFSDVFLNTIGMYYYTIGKKSPYYSTLLVLSVLGMYPKSPDPQSARLSFVMTIGTVIFAFLICNVGGIGHLMTGGKSAEMSEDLAFSIGGLGFLTCAFLFKMQWKRWVKLMLVLTNFKSFGKPDEFDTVKDRCNLYSMIFSFYILGGSSVYALSSILEMQCDLDKENNFCGTLTQIRLPIKGAIPPLIIKIIFFFQYLVCTWACVGSGNIFVLTTESTEFLICHMNRLKTNIKEIYHFGDEVSRKKQLLWCVNYHKTIIEWSMELNYLVRTTLGHMSLIAAILMGMISNQVINMYKPIGAALYLGGHVLAMFCISHAGQRLWDESLSINRAVYDSEWNTGSSKMRKDLAFMMARSQKPLKLSALPLGNLNYALFIMMLKAAYSYLTLLQRSTNDDK